MDSEPVLRHLRDGLVTLTINDPESYNPLSRAVLEGLERALAEAQADAAVRVVVLTGAGKAFSAGGDVREMAALVGLGQLGNTLFIRRFQRMFLQLLELEKPTIAAVNGLCVGAACNLVLACDMAIAAEGARFAEIFVRRGLVPDLAGMFLLPRAVGLARAKELIFSGEMVDAAEAARIGLVNQVVPLEELVATVEARAADLVAGPPAALSFEKIVLNHVDALDPDRYAEWEALLQGMMTATSDHQEGLRALGEKRRPQFQGR